jgi:hypothetical protein
MTRTVADELESITRMFCEKYADRSESGIESMVHDVYTHLVSEATVTAHLIPLTVNRCQRMLTKQRKSAIEGLKTVTG